MQKMHKTEEQQQYGIARLVAFSDGVFGFAITLLIINVISAFPSLPSSASDEQLVGALLGLGSSFFSYVLSFYVVGAYWVAHHRMFSSIIRSTKAVLSRPERSSLCKTSLRAASVPMRITCVTRTSLRRR
jgi:uncharacterized membrane protein